MGRDVDGAALADYEEKLMVELQSLNNQVFIVGNSESKSLTWIDD